MSQNSPSRGEGRLRRRISDRGVVLSALAGVVSLLLFTPLSVAGVVGTAGRYGVAVIAILPRLPDAVDVTREEYERTAAERDAFEQFTQRVAAIEPADGNPAHRGTSSESPATGPVATRTTEVPSGPRSTPGETPLEGVREAYRETVMAVPHYEEEYGEPLEENMAAELGPEVARAVTEGEVLPRQLQATLLQKSQQAYEQRADFLHPLENEYETLVDARRRLRGTCETTTSIEESMFPRPVREIVQSWERLDKLEDDCEDLLAERQAQLHERTWRGPSRSLQLFLYRSRPWTYPVLNDGLDAISRIREAKRRAVEAIYNW